MWAMSSCFSIVGSVFIANDFSSASCPCSDCCLNSLTASSWSLAMDKGQSSEVKQFARRMVEDHTKANVELKQIADKKNLVVPTRLDDQHEKAYDQLAKLDGANFDKEYMRVMATDHDEATKLFKEQSQRGQDPELKSFAMKTLPTIEKHDDMAHMDQNQMGAQPVTQPGLPRK